MREDELRNKLIDHLDKVWDEFETRILKNADFGGSLFPHIHLNKRFLGEAIEHTIVDLQRWVKFHNFTPANQGEKNPDKFKYAGFLSKWIAKIKPIYIEDCKSLKTHHFYVNAFFACFVFRSFIRMSLHDDLIYGLVYIFHFREMKGENLAFLAYALEKSKK